MFAYVYMIWLCSNQNSPYSVSSTGRFRGFFWKAARIGRFIKFFSCTIAITIYDKTWTEH